LASSFNCTHFISYFFLQIVVFTNDGLRQPSVDEQLKNVEIYFIDAVQKDQFSQQHADQQLEGAAERMDQQMGTSLIIGIVMIITIGFLFFIVNTLIFYFLVKFALKGEGNYKTALTSYGLSGFITAFQILITLLLMLVMNDIKIGTLSYQIVGV